MISFILALAVLVLGYVLYGRLAEKVFSPDDRLTPAITDNDGVDFIPVKTHKAVLIQLLNIAGTGPIFGALMGACFGPVVFLWIVFGAILGGAVHDYMSGMISERHKGASIAELSGKYLGKPALYIMRIFSVLLLLLTGTVFVTSPAELIASLTPDVLSKGFWIVVILIYYLLATLMPIDKIIGKLYPVFAWQMRAFPFRQISLTSLGWFSPVCFSACCTFILQSSAGKVQQSLSSTQNKYRLNDKYLELYYIIREGMK